MARLFNRSLFKRILLTSLERVSSDEVGGSVLSKGKVHSLRGLAGCSAQQQRRYATTEAMVKPAKPGNKVLSVTNRPWTC